MTKNKYEVAFDHDSKKFLVMGGVSTEELNVLDIFGGTDVEKSRAYSKLAEYRSAEKARRKSSYKQGK